MKKIFLMIVLTTISLHEHIIAKNQENATNTTQSIFGSNVSEETNKLAHELLAKIDPNKKLNSVIQMNSFMRYWLGEKNALAIPGLNCLIVNEHWLKKLSPEAQRFVIGRTLVALTSEEYITFSCIIPALIWLCPPLRATGLLQIIPIYLARKAEYTADANAIAKFDCLLGAADALEDMKQIPNNVNLFGLIPLLLIAKKIIPCKLTNRTSKLGSIIRDLPIIQYLSNCPSTQSRIDALEKL